MGDKVETAAYAGTAIGLVLLLFIILTLLTTLIIYAGWNIAIVTIFHVAPIDWLVAFGLSLIANVLRSIFAR